MLWKPGKGYPAQPKMSEKVSWRRLCLSCLEGCISINQVQRRGQALLGMISRFGLTWQTRWIIVCHWLKVGIQRKEAVWREKAVSSDLDTVSLRCPWDITRAFAPQSTWLFAVGKGRLTSAWIKGNNRMIKRECEDRFRSHSRGRRGLGVQLHICTKEKGIVGCDVTVFHQILSIIKTYEGCLENI